MYFLYFVIVLYVSVCVYLCCIQIAHKRILIKAWPWAWLQHSERVL